jgi:hypothetical protein
MLLASYFEDDQVDNALASYQQFIACEKPTWDIGQKGGRLDLYREAAIAFDPITSDNTRRTSFGLIYQILKGKWYVFRAPYSVRYWCASEVYDALLKCEPIAGRRTGRTLLDLSTTDILSTVAQCCDLMKEVKSLRSKQAPIMTLSKFLHFFNPCLFPIWDNAVVNDFVLKRFKQDAPKVDLSVHGGESKGICSYVSYVLLASSVMQKHPHVMDRFIGWVCHQSGWHQYSSTLGAEIHEYYSWAFETIAIGAAKLESSSS